MKDRELSMKQKQANWKLKEQKNSIRTTAQKLGTENTIWSISKKKENIRVLCN